jgi:predicted nucleic acid-binding protein
MMTIGPRPAHLALVLDTDVLNDWRFQKPPVVKAITQYISVAKAPPALASVTVFEALHGFEKMAVQSGATDERTRRGAEQTRNLIAACTVLPFDQQAAEVAAYIFPRLSRSERARHWADLLIAATALAQGYGVATRNKSDYELIAKHTPPHYPTLLIEVWK